MNPYQSPSEDCRSLWVIRLWQRLKRFLTCDPWECKEEFVMDDFIWFKENCSRCGRCRPWEHIRRQQHPQPKPAAAERSE